MLFRLNGILRTNLPMGPGLCPRLKVTIMRISPPQSGMVPQCEWDDFSGWRIILLGGFHPEQYAHLCNVDFAP